MSKKKVTIWGRSFSLNTILAHFPDENVLESQEQALDWFLCEPLAIGASKDSIEKYLLKNNAAQFPDKKVDNIFKYVMPKSIFVPHDRKHQTVAIMCDYKFDLEHGLAVVFADKKFKTIGAQDIVL